MEQNPPEVNTANSPASAGPTVVNLSPATPPSGSGVPLKTPNESKHNFQPLVFGAVAVLALVLIVGGWFFLVSSKKLPGTAGTQLQSPTAQNAPAAPVLTLTVDNPTNNLLVTSKTLAVSGKTLPNVTIEVYTDNDENSVQSDDQGNFSTSVSLDRGINSVTVTAFSDAEQKSASMNVVYDDGSSS